jgi:hypothetical protein
MSVVSGKFTREPLKHTIERVHRPDGEGGSEEPRLGPEEFVPPKLKEWDPTTITKDFFIGLWGKRRTGKSTWAKWFLQYHQDDFCLVWCMTHTKADGFWQNFVGDKFTYGDWNPGAVMRLIEHNSQLIKEWAPTHPFELRKGCATLIILDDVISPALYRDPVLVKLATEGRHYMISVLYMSQDTKTVSPMIRDNLDLAVLFNQKTARNKKSIWEDYLNDVTPGMGRYLLSEYAVNHDALIAAQTNLDGTLSKNFFTSTGDKTKLVHPNYILGGPQQKLIVKKEREEAKLKYESRIRQDFPKPDTVFLA